MKNYYQILNVDSDSSQNDIKKAYYKLALQYHPDKCGDESMFADIQEAWQVLNDPEKREKYNQTLFADTEDVAISDEIHLDEFTFDGDSYCYQCRCGGTYEINSEDLEQGIELVECDQCSLIIKVLK